MPIAYKRPNLIWVDADTPVTLTVEGLGKASAADDLKNLPGVLIESDAPLTPTVTAKLSGPSDEVAIEAQDDATQMVSKISDVSWRWQVRGKRPGTTTLTLEIYANFKIDIKMQALQVKTYNDQFPVRIEKVVPHVTYWIDQIDPIWKFLGLGTPVAIILGIVAYVGRQRNRRADPPPSPQQPASKDD